MKMDDRMLTEEEIELLEEQGCIAEDWGKVRVSEYFQPIYVSNVSFYGSVTLGVFEKLIEIEEGFFKHSGLRRVTLRNTIVGDNTLIENVET